jgi:DNA-binding FadR family transcriptional regulator
VRNGRVAGGRAAVFAPLEVGRRADAVVRRLSDGIRLGLLAPGEQLPSESDLAGSFGVSAVTVREALTALRGQGLLITRRGRNGGSFVREPDHGADHDDSGVLRDRLAALSPSELRDLTDHYVAIGGTCAMLAAERAGEQDLALIADSVGALERATDAGARRRAESRFHVELAAAAQSPRLTRAVIDMQPEIGPLLWSAVRREEVLQRHREILAAVLAGDGATARALTVAHLYAALAGAGAVQLTLLTHDAGPVTGGDPVAAVVERVATICEGAFAAVEGLRGAAEQLLRPWSEGGPVRVADVEPIARVVRPVLEAPATPLVGAGLVLAPGVLADADLWMEWWHHSPTGAGIVELEPVLDPSAASFYDYTVLPWFAIPRDTGARHVTGPYVDHLCTKEYTLTFTVPISAGHPERGRCHLGVVGADVMAGWIERGLLPLLRRVERPTALVNTTGRVAVSNDPALVAGAVVHEVDVPALWAGRPNDRAQLHRLPGLPLAVLVL